MSPRRERAGVVTVSSRQVAAFRLDRHHLTTRLPADALSRVAGDVAGVQAQLMSAAQISLWARTRGLTIEDIEDALWRDRTLVKVWCMRGTTHLVPAEDFAVFVRGCERRANRSLEWMVRAGLSGATIDRVSDAVRKILDRPRTRKEILPLVADALGARPRSGSATQGGWGSHAEVTGLEIDGQTVSIGGILYVACIRGVACVGPHRGNEATYVRRDVWLPGAKELSAEAAESELLRRYFRAYGPVTVADFARWTYMKAADARQVWSRLEDDLACVDVDGRPGWILRSDLGTLERATLDESVVRLLPAFDALLLGHKDKSHLVDAAHYKRVYRPAAWVSPVVLVYGRVAGEWSHARKRRRLEIRVDAFGRLTRPVRTAVQEEAHDLGRFLELPDVRVSFTGGGRGSRPSNRPGPRRPPARGPRGVRGPP